MREKFIAGNWKMNKTIEESMAFADEFKGRYRKYNDVKVGICGTFTQLYPLVKAFEGTGIETIAQNIHFEERGAFTGEISVNMIKEIGVKYSLVGHSERREYFAETDETINKKLHKALEHEITPILCLGENLSERDEGKAFEKVSNQLTRDLKNLDKNHVKDMIIAYEPIWAIGTGRTATKEQAEEMCKFIRATVSELYDNQVGEGLTIQYGGSVKPDNAKEILNMGNIDGALVGGASLKPDDFIRIVEFNEEL